MDTQPDFLVSEERPERPGGLGGRSLLREVLETLLLIIGIYTLVNLATARFVVEGESMVPTFQGEEFVIVSRLDYIAGSPQRGDIVVFHYPRDADRDFIKRLIGLPGEFIQMRDGRVYVNGVLIEEPYIRAYCTSSLCRDKAWLLGEDEYFVLGDNRNESQDSTRFGAIQREHLVGRAWIKYWPPEEWGIIQHHDYNVDIPARVPPELLP
ncbi:MAG: signal peptidase I, partial [Anaerolineae bacterium]|nr:signal peptidase I [Anaerolineae bacterium]